MMGSGDTGSQYANISVKIVDKLHRRRSTQDVVDWLSGQIAHIPGIELATVSQFRLEVAHRRARSRKTFRAKNSKTSLPRPIG